MQERLGVERRAPVRDPALLTSACPGPGQKATPNDAVPLFGYGTAMREGRREGLPSLEETRSTVACLREHRPEPEFVVSMRTRWDPLIDAHDDILVQLDAYHDAGVGHVVAEPAQRTVDDYLRSTRLSLPPASR